MRDEHFEANFSEDARAAELAQIVGYIKDGSSCEIVGLPGVSRSTLLGLLAFNKAVRHKHLGDDASRIHFVLVDFSEMRKRSLFEVMKYLFLNLTESLRERGMREENIAVGDIFREHLQFHDELVLFQGFKEAIDYMALEKKLTVVFLFDRFEEYIPTVTSEFFSNLRILRNRGKYRFSLVFSVNRPLEDMLEPILLADYYEYIAGHTIYLGLADAVLSDRRIAYIEEVAKKKVPIKLLDQIRKLTGGHGKTTKLAVEAVLAQEKFPEDLEPFLLAQKTVLGALTEIWLSLTPAEQTVLMQQNLQEIAQSDYLCHVGLVRNHTLQIPLLEKYIKQLEKTSADQKHAIIYDEHTNSITKGQIVISDQLTSSEFRMLRYLLQHADTIVDRDELIDAVWKELKSTAGITDQAVDQLVFRVRRKIEEDPNHPVHLQTVKGRGFRFQQ